MGIFSDILANAISIDIAPPTTALDKSVVRELNEWVKRGDVAYPAALLQATEVQEIKQYASDPSAGNFTLTFVMFNGETFTTAGILFSANAATIETAIDTAATGVVTGWTNGDISVGGGTLEVAGADVTLTFDGASVIGANHVQTTIEISNFTGGSLDSPAQTTTTDGQNDRSAWGALEAMGIVAAADIPAQGDATTAFTASTPGGNANYPSQATIRALADEAAIDDTNLSSKTEILAATKLPA